MNASIAHNTPPAHTPTVILPDTSNSATIHDVAIQDSATGPHDRSTTSTWNDSSQRELTVKELSGKRGAHHSLRGGLLPKARLRHICRREPASFQHAPPPAH